MTTIDKLKLGFGYNAGLPDSATFAFGARLIVSQDGYVDFVHDRTSIVSKLDPTEHLATLDRLNEEYRLDKLLADVKSALTAGALDTRGDDEIAVRCGSFTMKANCQSSAGYCYIVVYPTADEPA